MVEDTCLQLLRALTRVPHGFIFVLSPFRVLFALRFTFEHGRAPWFAFFGFRALRFMHTMEAEKSSSSTNSCATVALNSNDSAEGERMARPAPNIVRKLFGHAN